MFTKANLLSTLVTAIWGVGGSYLLWGFIADPLMEEYVSEGILKSEVDPIVLSIGLVIMAFAFSTIYGQFGKRDYGPLSGFRMGLLVALIGIGKKVIDFATANLMTFPGTLINSFVYILFFGIMGVLAGLMYQKFAE